MILYLSHIASVGALKKFHKIVFIAEKYSVFLLNTLDKSSDVY